MNKVETFLELSQDFSQKLNRLNFSSPADYVYNPLDYAWSAQSEYIRRYLSETLDVIFLGMNAGPWGMAQTGIPFGSLSFVQGWMNISENSLRSISVPIHEHPKKPVLGADCKREEVSGSRFWSLVQDCYPCAQHFFARHFVINYCPLLFTSKEGRNITPDKLVAEERVPLFHLCNTTLEIMFDLLQPACFVAIGKFAEKCLRIIQSQTAQGWGSASIYYISHPSPANPSANKNWKQSTHKFLKENKILRNL